MLGNPAYDAPRVSAMVQRGFGLVGVFVASWLAACADPAADVPSAQPALTATEATSEAAPLPVASATSEVAVLSAEKPPAPPPPPSASIDAKKLALENDLKQLDLEMLKVLSSAGVPTDNVLRDGAMSDRLLRELDSPYEAGRGRAGGLSLGSGGALRSGGGSGAEGLGSVGTIRGPGSTIGGKAAKDLTATDIDAALVRAGCTTTRLDSPSSPSDGPAVALFEAKCTPNSFTVTFVPVGATRPDAKAIAEMDRIGTTWSDSGMLLAIAPKEKDGRPAAIELMNKLRTPTSGPKGQASVGGAAVSGGNVSNAGAVVAGMAAGFRRCYNRGLQEDPKMKGTVRVTAKIGPNGEVLSASPSGGGGLTGTVTSCIAGVVSSRQFAAPEGGSATIVIPVSFTPME